ncbi:MAG: putative amidohydrolase [Francisellaceae bacterium]|jgi:predicted amidohydrolase
MVSKAAVVQMNSCASIGMNLIAAKKLITQAAKLGAKLVVLPECFSILGDKSVYYLSREILGEGRVQTYISNLARELRIWIVAGSIPIVCDKSPSKVYNASILYNSLGEFVTSYYKIHLFDVDIPGGESYRESDYFYPGDQTIVTDTPFGRLGMSICYDIRFPELYRNMLDQGAEIITLPSMFTSTTGAAHWEHLIKARAIENQCYLLAAGQSGYHNDTGKLSFGHSMIIDPWGKTLGCCEIGEGVVVAEINLEKQADLRQKFPSITNRRFELKYSLKKPK